jgi:YidC/Oxa1 family membrane protein insertase
MNIFNIILIQPLTNGLILFYRLLGGNMGLAIIGFSLFLRFLLNPLTKPYMESMKKIKEVEPQLKKLKEKYKNDQKGLLQAQNDFYKQKGINPSAGCLPYLLQIVVLIALFNVFTRALSTDGSAISKLNELLYTPLKFAQETTLNTKFLYLDVTTPDSFKLPILPFKLPGPMLILAALIQLVSARMMTPYLKEEKRIAKKTESKEDDLQVSMQKSMSLTFPLFTLIIGLNFPSGLVLYWLLFSLWQAVQQYQTSGWGGLTPLISKLGLLKSVDQKRRK